MIEEAINYVNDILNEINVDDTNLYYIILYYLRLKI